MSSASSPRDPDDDRLLSDATTGVALAPADFPQPTRAQLPLLNLTTATADVAAPAAPRTQLPPRQSLPRPPQHKSSFSVPPSSRPAQTYSVVESDRPSDTLHARAANSETVLRQLKPPAVNRMRRSPTRLSTVAAAYARTGSRSGISNAGTARSVHASSTDDLRHSLTRLGSSLVLERLRRRSIEHSAHATSAADEVYGHRRVSMARAMRRARVRFAQSLRRLTEPMAPHETTALVHNVLVLVVFALQVVCVPFAPIFLATSSDPSIHKTMAQVHMALDVLWLVDLALRFNTAIVVAESPARTVTITDRRALARHYAGGSFAVDALSSFPLELAYRAFGGSAIALVDAHATLYHVGIILRLLTVRRAAASLGIIGQSQLGQRIAASTWAIASLQITASTVLTVHVLACAWHAVLVATGDSGDGALAATYCHAVLEVAFLLVGDGSTAVYSIYNHGNTDGHATIARDVFVLGVVVLGVLLSATLFARLAVALLLTALDARTTGRSVALSTLTTHMTKLELPPALQRRVTQYYTHVWDSYGLATDRRSPILLSELSPPLALDVALSRYGATLRRLTLWKGCSADLLSALLVRIESRVYLRDDFVRRKGECADELLVLQRGACDVLATGDRVSSGPLGPPKVASAGSSMTRLDVGTALGVLALVIDYASPSFVRAATHVEVAVLTRTVFGNLVNRFAADRPTLVRRVLRSALETDECLALSQLAGLTDAEERSPRKIRDAAKRLVRRLEIDPHAPLRLPLTLEPTKSSTTSRPQPFHHYHKYHPHPCPQTQAPAQSSDPSGARDTSLETLAQLVRHVSDTVARLDARLTRWEERGSSTAAPPSCALLRRRSSLRESLESAASGLQRRPSNLTTTAASASDTESHDESFHVSRLFRPGELPPTANSTEVEGCDTLRSLPHGSDNEGAVESPPLRRKKRAQSLETSTRRRLVSFQQSTAGSGDLPPAHSRRNSLSAMWLRMTTSSSPAAMNAATPAAAWDTT